jgi:hypothetical protein
VSNIALYAYARLRMAAHRVVSATDPGEEKRLGSALFELAEELAHLDQIDGLLREYAPDEEADAFLEIVNGDGGKSCAELGCDHTAPKSELQDAWEQLLADIRHAFIDERGWLYFFGMWVGIIVGGFAVWWNP